MSPTPDRRARVRAMLRRRLGSIVVAAEAIHRRHNTSAILRSAEAFGVHEVHLVTAGFKPSRGAARGAERWLDIHPHPTVDACIDELKGRGFAVWVADLDPEALAPAAVPLDRPLAVLFGAELTGVSPAARARADGVVSVPMHGLTESLNVAAAAAVTLHVLTERRRALLPEGQPGDLPVERQEAFFQAWLEREEAMRRGLRARVG